MAWSLHTVMVLGELHPGAKDSAASVIFRSAALCVSGQGQLSIETGGRAGNGPGDGLTCAGAGLVWKQLDPQVCCDSREEQQHASPKQGVGLKLLRFGQVDCLRVPFDRMGRARNRCARCGSKEPIFEETEGKKRAYCGCHQCLPRPSPSRSRHTGCLFMRPQLAASHLTSSVQCRLLAPFGLGRSDQRSPFLKLKRTCSLRSLNFRGLRMVANPPPRKPRFAKRLVAAYIIKNMEGKLCG